MLTLGVLADTHILDHSKQLHPQILPTFAAAGVDAILHAGDICIPAVLERLEGVAPVHAVRGNRDWFGLDHLPLSRTLRFEELTLGLTHGHGNFFRYLKDKLRYFVFGPRSFNYFMRQAITCLPETVDVVVFGHNHAPMNRHLNGKLIFNPGSAHRQVVDLPPTVGLLRIDGSQAEGEIIRLNP